MYDYSKRVALARLKVGIVVTLGIMALVAGLLFAGGIGNLFTRKVIIHAVFQDVQGLRPGAPVRFSGVEIGNVKELYFDPASRIRANLSIRADVLKHLKSDSKAQLLTLGLLGDKYVGITTGTPQGKPLREGDTVEGELEHGFGDVVQSTEQVIGRVNAFIEKIQTLFDQLDLENGGIARLLSDPQIYQDTKASIRSLAQVLEKLNSGPGSLAMLLNDQDLYRRLTSAAEQIETFSTRLNTAEGSLQRLIDDPVLYDNLRIASQNLVDLVRQINAGEGTLAKLIQDDRLYANLESLTASLDKLLSRVDAGQGVLGKLARDERFFKELQNTVRELNRLIKDVRANPGKYFDFSLF